MSRRLLRSLALVSVLLLLAVGAMGEEEGRGVEGSLDGDLEGEGGRGELVTMTMDEFRENFGSGEEEEGRGEEGNSEREDRHMVGMCWQSEMSRCVNACQNETLASLLPASLSGSALLGRFSGLPVISDFLVEVCASYCQADVTYMCTTLNLDYGGVHIFRFGGRWPFARFGPFCQVGNVAMCVVALIMQVVFLRNLFMTESATEGVAERSRKLAAETKRRAETKGKKEEKETEEGGETEEEEKDEGEEEDAVVSIYPYGWMWQAVVALWAASFAALALFHTVDIVLTECLAYFTLLATILFQLYAAVTRSLGVTTFATQVTMLTPFLGYCFFHVFLMTQVVFDYGYHGDVVSSLVLIYLVLWLIWPLKARRRNPHVKALIWAQAWLLAALAAWRHLDVAPLLWLVDVHAVCYGFVSLMVGAQVRFYVRDWCQWSKEATEEAIKKSQ